MNNTVKRRSRNQVLFPAFGNILSELMNAPIHEIINDSEGKFTIPAANVIETEDHFELTLAIPGLTKKDVSIDLENDKLIISSEKDQADEGTYKLKEFNYGTFKRRFSLPKSVDQDKITASVKDGILSIVINKKEEQKPKSISIK